MKVKIASLVLLLFLANFAQGQVKFRVKKLNADSLVELIQEKEGIELIEALNLLSNVICRKNIDSSINLASQAIELSEKLEYQKGLADGYFNVGNGYFLLDSLQPTISNYLKALRIYEDLEPSVEFGNLCMQLSMVNYYTGRFKDNKDYCRQAIHIYERINDKTGQAIANLGMGIIIFLFSTEYDSAIYYHNKALSFLDPATDQNEVAYNYQGIANTYKHCYQKFRDTTCFTKALSYYFKAFKLPEIYADTRASIYLNLGLAYFYSDVEKSESNAILYLNKAKNIYDTCLDGYKFNFIIMGHFGLASYWKGDYDKAIFYFKQGIDIIEERLSAFSIEEFREPIFAYNVKYYLKLNKQIIYEHLYNTYVKLDDYKTAHEYYTLSKEAEEEIYKEKNQNLITMLESVSEDEKTEKQMALLARDNELKSLTIKQSRTYLFALAGFILVLVLVALLFIRQRKIRAEHKTFVREQKLLHDLELKNMESEKLKELDHLKSRFFANISHEFRTPLTLIMGPLEKVLTNIEDDENKKELSIAKKYAGKLQILINNLLTISKLESGKMELHTSETDVVKLVGTYIQSFESLAKQKNIELKFTSENKEIKAFIDREKFEQVLNNLLSNAFKFTGEGGTVQVTVTPLNPPSRGDNPAHISTIEGETHALSPLEGGRGVNISISDTGRGIAPEHINHIFDRFYQAGQENNSYYEGTGIGLALTKELVELHHGEIDVESEQGKGSTFSILLPLGKEHLNEGEIVDQNETLNFELQTSNIEHQSSNADFSEISNEQPISSNQPPENQPILLIVEDNSDMRSYIRGYFENEFRIIEAIDGADGYEKSTEHIPDIIISDVMMPNMDGVEFCKKVKADECTSHIPVILLTARASKESRMEGLETGADDFITKPFDGDELQVRVKNLIDQRKLLSAVLERKIQKSHTMVNLDFEDSGITTMDEQFLQKVMQIVKDRYSDPEFNTKIFGQAIGLGRIQLNRKIKALTGQTTVSFIRTFRLNRAAELIRKKSATVAEIAYDVGFNSPSYFTECFRLYFGKLPSEFTGSQ